MGVKEKGVKHIKYIKSAILCIAVSLILPLSAFSQPYYATTTVSVSVCGDGIVLGEVCDDGFLNNDGAYSNSIAGRRCLPDCSGYGPYCGDIIIHFLYSEECDDGNNSAGDRCSPICVNEEDPINTTDGGGSTGGGESGAGGQITGVVPINNPTRVFISGKAYAGSRVHILKDGEEITTVSANGLADFSKQLDNVTAGPATFGFWADDGSGLRSITFTTTFQVTQNAVTTVSGIYLPPTIKSDDTSVMPGEEIIFYGVTVPNAKVSLYIDGGNEFIEGSESDGSGTWEITFDTTPLEKETFHTAKVTFTLDEEFSGEEKDTESGFGQTVNFYVGEGEGADAFFADLNVDGRVNIVDFSILLFNWGGSGGGATPSPDINHDGVVNLTDFSIMIFYWTG
ncbi:MAG: DUF4215 domain-containing protein [Candidatus Pacebacteria bacterium]|nr:DUF4215 domain-containing protein [Candidatus Paceibacterota bacterium]